MKHFMLLAVLCQMTLGAATPEALAQSTVERTVQLTGRVVDACGCAVSSARVRYMPLGQGELLLAVPALPVDAEGRFALTAQTSHGGPDREWYLSGPPEDDRLLITADGYAPRCDQLDLTEDVVDLGRLPLVAAASVAGRLVDERLGPLPGAALRWERTAVTERERGDRHHHLSPARSGTLTTDEVGRFTLGPVWPGGFRLLIERPQRVREVIDVAVAAGETSDLGDLLVREGGVLSGRVVNDEGDGLARVHVAAVLRRPGFMPGVSLGDVFLGGGGWLPEDGDTVQREIGLLSQEQGHVAGLTDDTGHFVLRGLEPRTHQLYAWKEAADFEPARQLDAAIGEDHTLVLRSAASLCVQVVDGVSGRVLDWPASALAATRRASRDEPLPIDIPLMVRESADGIAGAPGGTLLVRGVGPLGTQLRALPGDHGYGDTAWLAPGVAPGERLLVRFVVWPAATLRVRVLDEQGNPLSGMSVELIPAEAAAWEGQIAPAEFTGQLLSPAPRRREQRTSAAGEVTFRGLGTDEQQLVVRNSRALWQSPDHSEALHLDRGEDRELELTLPGP